MLKKKDAGGVAPGSPEGARSADVASPTLVWLESRYGDQIRRYYRDRSHHNLIHPDKNRPANDPPF